MQLNGLEDLLVHELKDLYDAEHQISEALPKMISKTTNSTLRIALEEHRAVTQTHIERLERAFAFLNQRPTRKTCEAMKGLLKEGEELLKLDAPAAVRDAALIGSAQRVEHYEMAGYGTVRTYAFQLGYEELANLFQMTLDEEEMADKTLSQCANQVNMQAIAS
jgi:ferritin-like metal-binding protein YciE